MKKFTIVGLAVASLLLSSNVIAARLSTITPQDPARVEQLRAEEQVRAEQMRVEQAQVRAEQARVRAEQAPARTSNKGYAR